MTPCTDQRHYEQTCRRQFLGKGLRLGAAALMALLKQGVAAAALGRPVNPLATKQTHFPARAKNVIQLFMTGGPSHLDMFDYKPQLWRSDGQPLPESVLGTTSFAQIREGKPLVMRSPWGFKRHGNSGQWVCELLPHTAKVVDELTFIRTVKTSETVHPHATPAAQAWAPG